MFATIKAVVSSLRQFPEIIISGTSPMKLALGQRHTNLIYKELAKTGGFIEITSKHPDEKIAMLGRAFEVMLEDPLALKFMRQRPRAYINTLEAPNIVSSPVVPTHRTILLPQSALHHLSLDEAIASLGHEFGHLLALDMHPRRGMGLLFRRNTGQERLANDIATVLSKKPEALISGSQTLAAAMGENSAVTARAAAQGTDMYDSLEHSAKLIRQTAQKLTTPEGESFLRKELERRLEKEHRRLFPHAYDRQ